MHPDARPGQFVANGPNMFVPTPGMNMQPGFGSYESKDVFSRADKWLGQPPVPGVEKWSTREAEIAGFADYLVALQAWAALASMTFAEEIGVAMKWPEVIWQQALTEDQKVRSVRLFGILRSAFAEHARASLMIQAFSEGLSIDHAVSDAVRFLGNTSCGFELLRQLAQQFSLRSRAEALSVRSELLSRIFALKSSEMTAATMVGDVIRKIDIEIARFSKLLTTLPSHLDRQGLSIGDGDMLVILLRSLPEDAKKYVLHHSAADTYQVARLAALKYEQQQRLFLDLNLGGRKQVSELFDLTAYDHDDSYETAWYDSQENWETDGTVSAMTADRCEKCGRKGHKIANCRTDMNKVKCYSCGEYGHIGARCSKFPGKASGQTPEKGKGKDKGKDKGKSKGKVIKGKGKEKGKMKGKGKPQGGKGKKGKMYEITETAAGDQGGELTPGGGTGTVVGVVTSGGMSPLGGTPLPQLM